jgi:23S rRNA (cytosine1962-C5)-methyltransferase
MPHPELRLKKNEDRRLRAGHLWIFSNEVDNERTPVTGWQPGTLARVCSHNGKALGTAYVNPHSLICARMISRSPEAELDRGLIRHRLNIALGLRRRLYGNAACRLVFGEADGLPGLVIDHYGRVTVAQMSTAGMDARRDDIVRVIEDLLEPDAVVLREASGHPVVLTDGDGRLVGICGDDEIYRGLLRRAGV